MKRTILAASAAAFLGSVSFAFAADLPMKAPPPLPPPPSWTGFYIGANGGWGWANSTTLATTFQSGLAPNPIIPNQNFGQSLSGPVFGGHLGYNWQITNWLIGIEGDFDGTGINNSTTRIAADPLGGAGGFATDGFMQQTQIQWLASIRGRLGWVVGPNLFYITGGGAWEQVHSTVLLSTDTLANVFSTSATTSFNTTKSGWVAGLGYERMIANDWIVRAEYLHYGFNGSSTTPLPITCTFFGAAGVCGQNILNGNNHADVVRLGVSYKFF
jgi:outer membrane immunogenic protein